MHLAVVNWAAPTFWILPKKKKKRSEQSYTDLPWTNRLINDYGSLRSSKGPLILLKILLLQELRVSPPKPVLIGNISWHSPGVCLLHTFRSLSAQEDFLPVEKT